MLYKIRRDNLRALAEIKGSQKKLAKALRIDDSTLSKQIGRNARTRITDNRARMYEIRLGLEYGYLDKDQNQLSQLDRIERNVNTNTKLLRELIKRKEK